MDFHPWAFEIIATMDWHLWAFFIVSPPAVVFLSLALRVSPVIQQPHLLVFIFTGIAHPAFRGLRLSSFSSPCYPVLITYLSLLFQAVFPGRIRSCTPKWFNRYSSVAERDNQREGITEGAGKIELQGGKGNAPSFMDEAPCLSHVISLVMSCMFCMKVSGGVDWYGILGIIPLADEGTVKKQCRELALMLYPNKNKSIGADGTFKFVSEAWSLLSGKSKYLLNVSH
ncbi:hypothetical protein CK203_020004 [Vitis vinifera]|uniref:J domain-containing protein n=1 Tax=Vitis vinifera TaxID=29760 RepID=A0A438J2Y7_VITVI|nr:hypothetical protein CK203_020004 [Vitis vinifera]